MIKLENDRIPTANQSDMAGHDVRLVHSVELNNEHKRGG